MRPQGWRLLIRRLVILLLLVGVYLGGRWGWDALHPPSVARWKAEMTLGEAAMARVKHSSSRPNVDLRIAETHFRAAIGEARKFGRGHARLAQSYEALADMYQFNVDGYYYGDLTLKGVVSPENLPRLRETFLVLMSRTEAERAFRAAIQAYRQSANPNDPAQFAVWERLSQHYQWMYNDPVKAANTLQQALHIAERANGKDDVKLIPLLDGISALCQYNIIPPQYDRAYACVERSIRILEHAHGPNDGSICPYLRNLEELAVSRKDIPAANAAIRKFLLAQERANGATIISAQAFVDFADHIDGYGQPVDAKPLYLRALDIYEAKKDPAAGYIVSRCCYTYRLLGRYTEEEALLLRYVAWLKRSFTRGTMLYEAYSALAAFYHRRGDATGERTALAEQKRLYPAGIIYAVPVY